MRKTQREKIETTNVSAPGELILARSGAFVSGDFEAIYDSYHEDAPFKGFFPSRQSYAEYAEANLVGTFFIRECRVLDEVIDGDRGKVLFYQRFVSGDDLIEVLELAELILTSQGWRLHRSGRRPRQEFPVPLETIKMADFPPVPEEQML
ncbi:MAG: hypothetical protein C0621_04185 [Desulfuromonas sp.]|nr:MAG: hypothetical protein C0621_04185 [Desulfuromonas sp.]